MKTKTFIAICLMLFTATTGQAQTTNNETIDASTLKKLEGIWVQTYNDSKGVIGPAYLKLKAVNGNVEAWRVAKGKQDIKFTRFRVYKNEKGVLSFVYELNIPPGFKYEGYGEIGEHVSTMKGTELRTVKNLDLPIPPAQWTAKKGSLSTLATAANPTTSTSTTITTTSADLMETKFVTAFNAATDSKGRGKALGVLFGDVYKNASLSNEQKKSYMVRKVGEVYAIDKEAAFKGVIGADCSTQEIKEVFNSLPGDQKAFIQKRSQEVSSGFKQVH